MTHMPELDDAERRMDDFHAVWTAEMHRLQEQAKFVRTGLIALLVFGLILLATLIAPVGGN